MTSIIVTRKKGGPGSGHRGHSGRPGKRGGSTPGSSGRVWTGEQHEAAGKKPSRLRTGDIGEQLAMRALEDKLGAQFSTLNDGINNAPIDVAGDHHAIEVKAGLATNGPTSQYWRATVGQLGKGERAMVDSLSTKEKKEYYKWKNNQILERKNSMLDQMSADAGVEIKPATVGIVLSPDGSRGDVYMIPGFHLRLSWKQYATDDYYLGTYDVGQTKEWLKGGAGSGHHGHQGRPGKRGGSLPGSGGKFYDLIRNTKLGYGKVGEVSTSGGNITNDNYDELMRSLGHSDESINEVKMLLNVHGYGGAMQEDADAEMLDHIDNNTPVGQALKDHIELETTMHNIWLEDKPKRAEEAVSREMRNFDYDAKIGYDHVYDGVYYGAQDFGGSLSAARADLEITVRADYNRPVYLYRKGSLEGRIQSWSRNQEGAVMGRPGEGGIGWDIRLDYAEVEDNGYKILGGYAKMMGAPGESEVTLIKM